MTSDPTPTLGANPHRRRSPWLAVLFGLAFFLSPCVSAELLATGNNSFGQLGDGTITPRSTPVQILASGVQAVALGDYHTMILKADGSLWGTGYNFNGQLGDGTTTYKSTPVQILASGVQAVAAGPDRTMILKTDGSLWGTGANGYGQLGDGTTTDRRTPVQIFASGVRAIAAGGNHTMILKTDGSLWGAGYNVLGQLGDGTTTNRSTPVQILASGVQAVALGDYHTMILKADGSLWATGSSSLGQFGDGTTSSRSTPVQILASGVQAVAARSSFSLIVKTDGSLWGTGSNGAGQLGDGTNILRTTLVQILTSGVQAVAAGNAYTMILKTDGSLWGTGRNSDGQFGNGTTVDTNTPVQILASGVQAVATGWYHTMIVKAAPSAINYTISYSANSGTGTIANATKVSGIDVTLADGSGFTRTGYTFAGWNTVPNGSGTTYAASGTYTANANATLYAQWTLNTFPITYSANGGSGTIANATKSYGINLTLADGSGFTRTGYTFAGWNTVSNGSGTAYAASGTYTANANATLYAQWTMNTFPITYSPNGGTGTIANATKSYGINLTLADGSGFTRTGYTFAGWNTAADGGGTAYVASGTYTANAGATFYAQWTLMSTFAVAYDANGGTGTIANVTKVSGIDLTLADGSGFTRTGYTFTGWTTAADGGGTAYAASGAYTVNASATLYAQWALNSNLLSDSDDDKKCGVGGVGACLIGSLALLYRRRRSY